MTLVDELISESGLNSHSQGLMLECYFELKQLKEGEKLANLLCEQYPESARIHFISGKIFFRLRKYKKAEACFRTNQALFPSFSGTIWLAKALTNQQNFDEARSLLSRLDTSHPLVLQELAWLYERSQNDQKALECYEKALPLERNTKFLNRKVEELRAKLTDHAHFLEEMETLEALDEEIPDHLIKSYFEKQLAKGEQERVRQYYRANKSRFNPKLCNEVGWVCYRAKCYDLSFELFLAYFLHDSTYWKLNNALQKSAEMSGKTGQLVAVFRKLAKKQSNLYGRIKKLEKMM